MPIMFGLDLLVTQTAKNSTFCKTDRALWAYKKIGSPNHHLSITNLLMCQKADYDCWMANIAAIKEI